jgi:hypothetical protein
MANWNPAGVYLPGWVAINATNFAVDPSGYPAMNHALLSFNGSWTGSSLTLTLTPPYPGVWTFIDEVTFSQARPGMGSGTGSTVPDATDTLPLAFVAFAGLFVARRQSTSRTA